MIQVSLSFKGMSKIVPQQCRSIASGLSRDICLDKVQNSGTMIQVSLGI